MPAWIFEQLPALIIVVPLMAAPFTVLMPAGRLPWAWAVLTSWATLVLAVLLMHQVIAHGPISYELGAWAPPHGIEFRVDLTNALVLLLVAFIAAVVFPYAGASVDAEIDKDRTPFFYGMLLICFTGLMGVTITGDAFNLFVFLEISSLSTYALIAMGKDRRALTSAFNYLVMGTIGATFYVIGVGLLYMATGTLNMADLAAQIAAEGDNRMIRAGFAFIVVGMGLKLAMFPLHLWLPGAYTYAPSAVTAFLAATATKTAVYVLIRFLFTIYGVDYEFEALSLTWILLPLGVIGMLTASLVAVFQVDVKKMLAYSSVAQIGYMLVGLSFGTATGIAAALVHVFNHALMKGALFMAMGCVMLRLGTTSVEAFNGLARRMPLTAGAFIFSALSLVGVPLTVGFISKWYLLSAAFGEDAWWVAVLIVISSLLAVIYIARVAFPMLLAPAPTEGPLAKEVKEAPLSMLVPMWLLTLANIYFGIDATFTGGIAEQAAAALLEGAGS